jgi:hypothetical protein
MAVTSASARCRLTSALPQRPTEAPAWPCSCAVMAWSDDLFIDEVNDGESDLL